MGYLCFHFLLTNPTLRLYERFKNYSRSCFKVKFDTHQTRVKTMFKIKIQVSN